MALELFIGGVVALICGLDRVAILQILISRPIVAAPLAGLLLGEPLIGLQIGVMVELLWLARLPVGASVPPDDTQVAVAATVLSIVLGRHLDALTVELMLLCLLIALPIGKIGQYFEHRARNYNSILLVQTDQALQNGLFGQVQQLHLRGLLSFATSSLLTYLTIVLCGLLLIPPVWPWLQISMSYSAGLLQLALPLIGVAVILGTINVSRSITLFCASFGMAFLLMWLVQP
ncbi:MAG: PTS sugar transporter subunit IIC [Pelovirga sp.]